MTTVENVACKGASVALLLLAAPLWAVNAYVSALLPHTKPVGIARRLGGIGCRAEVSSGRAINSPNVRMMWRALPNYPYMGCNPHAAPLNSLSKIATKRPIKRQ